MQTDFYAFGEMLWDCMPSGEHPGGAPFNVAVHLCQLGASAALISAIGQDLLGDRILKAAQEKGIHVQFVTRARPELKTGTVQVAVDASGNATYEIVRPVAWDEIQVSPTAVQAVARARALVFGSLAGRSPYNLDQLDSLLGLDGPVKFFDVNLRPPFDDAGRVFTLARRADVIKLNDDEVFRLAAHARNREVISAPSRNPDALAHACAAVSQATRVTRICVTRGADGAALWDRGSLLCVPAPRVTVKDTVGAGDAFMAGLVFGLTRRAEPREVLENACRLGAFVASQDGATPPLPADIIQKFQGMRA